MASPNPTRRANASLRTHRPTTYYDTEKDSTRVSNLPKSTPERPTGRSPYAGSNQPTSRDRHGETKSSASSRPAPHPPSMGESGRGTPRPRDQSRGIGLPSGVAGKSKVGAALRNKRQSVSYGPLAPPRSGDAPPMPAMPKAHGAGPMPDERVSRRGRDSPAMRRRNDDSIRTVSGRGPGGMEIDMDSLKQDNFDPEKYLKVHLAIGGGSDAHHLKAFKDRLRSAQEATNQELQENVYKNYTAFVAISKEIATLENEMLELKSVLEDFRTLPGDLDMGLGTEEFSMSGGNLTNDIRRRTARNSVADVNALYRTQLEALWETVEGSQKFLPIIPGRHLLAESRTFVELNSITYKPKHNVHLFLLNDALLVAVSKRTGMGSSKVKLIADKCFNVADISVVDLKDGGDLENAIKIKRGRESVIFRTDRTEDKKALLSSFKKVADELSSRKRKQSIMDAENRRTIIQGGWRTALDNHSGDQGVPFPTMYEEPLGLSNANKIQPSKILGFGKDDPTGKDLSWIGDLSDELAVSIACRSYDEASELIEKAKTILDQLQSTPSSPVSRMNLKGGGQSGGTETVQYSLLKSKIDVKSQELTQKLLEDLLDPAIRKSQVIKIASLITKLSSSPGSVGLSMGAVANIEKAKQRFLAMRSELVNTRSRMIKFEGDITLWVSQLAMMIFTLVKNTCEWYMMAFRDNRMASGFVRWAAEQIELYAEIFRRQIYGADQDPQAIQDSLGVTMTHAGMLKEVGLDFGFLLESLLRPEAHSRLRPRRRRSMDDVRDKRQSARRERSMDRYTTTSHS